ncbi:MAG: tyrosine-type recombinase/integrase [Methanococcoides sp.]|nr:tyrosine-type recombinase/integrase [Methanococcoides sp.]
MPINKNSQLLKELELDGEISSWLDAVAERESTRKSYLQSMIKYLDFTGLTPTELLDEANEEEENLPKNRRSLKKYFSGFKAILKDGGEYQNGKTQKPLAEKSIKTHIAVIKSFYNANEITLPFIKKSTARRIKENDDRPTKEQLSKVLELADIKMKAIILIGTSSGLAMADILNLKVKDIRDVDENDITTMRLQRQKTGVDFISFFSPQATRAIKSYLEYRNGYGTSINDDVRNAWHNKHKVNSENDYLFINDSIPDSYLASKNEEVRKIARNTFLGLFNRLSNKASLSTEKGTFNVIRSHNMRKYFYTAMMLDDANNYLIDFFAGKTIPEDKETYFKASVEETKKLYLSHVNVLSFDDTEVLILKDSNYKALEKQYEDGIKQLRMENEIENLKIRMEMELKPIQQMIESHKNTIKRDDSRTAEKNIAYKMIRGNEQAMQRVKEDYEAKIAEIQKECDESYGHIL